MSTLRVGNIANQGGTIIASSDGIMSPCFGDNITTYSYNQTYYADTDLLITAYNTVPDHDGSLIGYSNGQLVTYQSHHWDTFNLSIFFPVKKGESWQVASSRGAVVTVTPVNSDTTSTTGGVLKCSNIGNLAGTLSTSPEDLKNKNFGNWTYYGDVNNSIFKAETDLLVMVYITVGDNGGGVACYTDSNPSPSTLVYNYSIQWDVYYESACFPVKKGDYWKVSCNRTPTVRTLSWGA